MKKLYIGSSLAFCATLLVACGPSAQQQQVQETTPVRHVEVQDVKQLPGGKVIDMPAGSDQAALNALLSQNALVVVDFYADWCGPCKQLIDNVLPNVIAKNGDVLFVKVNTDKCPALSQAYNIKSLPTLMFFKNGQRVNIQKGGPSAAELNNMIQRYLR